MSSVSFPRQPSSRYPTTSADRFRRRNGSTRSSMACPSTCFVHRTTRGSYLAFLGRLTAEKGPEDAIRIARAVGMPLRIAAKIPRAETAYFKKQLSLTRWRKG